MIFILSLWSVSASAREIGLEDLKPGFYQLSPSKGDASALQSTLGSYLFVGSRLRYRPKDEDDSRSSLETLDSAAIKNAAKKNAVHLEPGVVRQFFGVFSFQGALRAEISGAHRLYWSVHSDDLTSRHRAKLDIDDAGCITLSLVGAPIAPRRLVTVDMTYLGREIDEVSRITGLKVPATRYYAHRGSAFINGTQDEAVYPTNTRGAVRDALEQGYHGVEVDLRLTKDLRWMISHDDKLAVATSCESGRVAYSTFAQLQKCRVEASAVFPEAKFFRSFAPVDQPMWTPTQLIAEFAGDPRVEKIILDVKPFLNKQGKPFVNVTDWKGVFHPAVNEGELIVELLKPFPKPLLSKLLILVRNPSDEATIENGNLTDVDIPIAIEGSTGFEVINAADQFASPAEQAAKRAHLEEIVEAQGAGGALSISVGIGLAFGTKEQPVGRIFGMLSELGRAVADVVKYHTWDLADLSWGRKRKEAMEQVMDVAAEHRLQTLAWTVNSRKKLMELRAFAPRIDGVLTDLPFYEIARVQMNDLEVARGTPHKDALINRWDTRENF